MMRLLLDEGLPRSAALLLRNEGIDAVHVGDIGATATDDEEILRLARQHGRVVVTLDADFHALLALSGATSPSVVRIRIEGLRGPDVVRLLRLVIGMCGDELRQGAALSVQERRIRVRKLPLPT